MPEPIFQNVNFCLVFPDIWTRKIQPIILFFALFYSDFAPLVTCTIAAILHGRGYRCIAHAYILILYILGYITSTFHHLTTLHPKSKLKIQVHHGNFTPFSCKIFDFFKIF